MKKTTKITTAIVVSVGLAAAGAAYAAKSRLHGEDYHAQYAVGFIASKLDLDSNQEQSLSALKDQVLIAKSAMHEQMQTTHDEVRGLVQAESFDQGKALALITAKTATIDTVAPELVVALGNFMDSLNAEQKQEILDFVNDHHDGRKGKHWRH